MGGGSSTNRRSPTNAADVTSVRQGDNHSAHFQVGNSQYEILVTENVQRENEVPVSATTEEIELPSENIVQSEGEVGLAIAMTPREFEKSSASNSFSGVPYTPQGEEASIFKYYCPLCMQYFKQIMKMKCCGNYMCIQCCKDYVGSKGVHLAPYEGIAHIEDRFITPNSIYCPHCQVCGYHPIGVNFEEAVRDYHQHSLPQQDRGIAAYSPLRVGETFEDLKRKMIPYKSFQIIKTTSDDGTYDSETVHLNDPVSPAYLVENNTHVGIAMVHGAGDETPVLRSPRMQLEPNTPGHMRLCLYHPDGNDVDLGGHRLFQEEHSGSFAHDIPHHHNAPGYHEETSGIPLHPTSTQAIEEHWETTTTDRSRDRPPLSRAGSAARIVGHQSSEKTYLRGQCCDLATNLIDQWMGSALAQYPAGNIAMEASQ